jgi:hypothetical protein
MSSSTCTSCSLDTILDPIAKICIATEEFECPSQSFLNESRLCEKCSMSCGNCTGIGSHDCVDCNDGFYMYDGFCVRDCPPTYFLDYDK